MAAWRSSNTNQPVDLVDQPRELDVAQRPRGMLAALVLVNLDPVKECDLLELALHNPRPTRGRSEPPLPA